MAKRYQNSLAQAANTSGNSIAGAKLNFYEAGTSTRANTYSDNALSVANANPVIADGSGRFDDIFLQGIDYRVVLTDADDTLLDEQDPFDGKSSDTGVVLVGDGVLDDTARLQTFFAAYTGGLVIMQGTFNVTLSPVVGTPDIIGDFLDLNGVDIDASTAKIIDNTTYSANEFAYLFRARGCDNININVGLITSQNTIETGGTILDLGLTFLRLTDGEGCHNVDLKGTIQGGYTGLRAAKSTEASAESQKSTNLTVDLKCTNVHYPYSTQFSGDNAIVKLDNEVCGRNYFLTGVENVDLTCYSKNAQKSAQLQVTEGATLANVKIKDIDRESDNNQPAANHVTFGFEDTTAAQIRNLELILDLVNPSASPWGNSVVFKRTTAGASNHALDGLKISGTINHEAAGNACITQTGTPTAGDIYRNCTLENLSGVNGDIQLALGANLDGGATVINCDCTNRILVDGGTGEGRVTYMTSKAANFTTSTADTDIVTYINCDATDGSTQSVINKTFISSTVGANDPNRQAFSPTLLDTSLSPSEGQGYGGSNGGFITVTGKMVHFSLRLQMTSLGTLSTANAASVGGLPRVSSSSANNRGAGVVTYFSGIAQTNIAGIHAQFQAGTSVMVLYPSDSATGPLSPLTVGEVTASGDMIIVGSYPID